jgi:hypothetical protein
MRKALVLIIVALFIASFAVAAIAAEKPVVGEIKDVVMKDGKIVSMKIADEKQGGKVVEVKCDKECKLAKGTTAKAGEKVTIEFKAESISIRKAVAGC